jgi:5-methylthioadenosine/S-adenosylhomocysteine deaminase
LLKDGSGPFAEAWRGRNIPLPSPLGATPVAWLDRHGVLGPRTLCIHVVQVDAGDIGRLASHGVAVAHCPRSNRAHAHGVAPLADLRQAGLRIGLGTDSVVSVETLDLLAEARAARELAGLDAAATVALCTLDGARALDLDRETGSLTPGKWADLVALRSPAAAVSTAASTAAAEELVLACGPGDVLATFVGGRDVYRHHRSP